MNRNMTMRAATYGRAEEATPIDATRIQFVADDGRVMFEVTPGKDGRSIEVRGVEACKVDGVMYASYLDLRLAVSNVVYVRAREYDDIA